MNRRLKLVLCFAVLPLVFDAGDAAGQSIVSGSVSGTVASETGLPMSRVHVRLTEVGTGVSREMETRRDGHFEFGFVTPGDYELFAERLGERPVRVEGIVVGSGARVSANVTLMPATPPVTDVQVLSWGAGGGQQGGPDGARRFGTLEEDRLPHRTREIAELGRYSSRSTGSLASEGLPGRYAGVVVDGVAYQSAGHLGLAEPVSPTAPFLLSAFDGLELMANGIDVEYGGFAAPSLVGFTKRGTRQLEVSAFGDWQGSALATSDHFSPQDVSHTSMRGGLLASGPIVPDTAYFVIGAEAQRSEQPLPRFWAATDADAALLSTAADSFDTDLSPYTEPGIAASDLINVFGRLDWRFGSRTTLMVRAMGSGTKADDPVLGANRIRNLGTTLQATDVSGAASLTTSFTPSLGLELRVGAEYSNREFASNDITRTVFSNVPVFFGAGPMLPGDFQRFAFRANETLHIRQGSHNIKLGGTATVSSLNNAYQGGVGGQFLFGGVDEYAGTNGSFVQAVGTVRETRLTTAEVGGFLQDAWMVIPGLEVTAGIRLDAELLPGDEVTENEEWASRTGLERADTTGWSVVKFSPRFGFVWNVGQSGKMQLRGAIGVHHASVTTGSLTEFVSGDGSMSVRRGVGLLGAWPQAPDSTAAPIVGPRLTLLGPDFVPPKTTRASFGISAAMGSAAMLHLSAVYRHTEFLPRRHDLNLVSSAIAEDQYGRPIYGELTKVGGLLAAEPGSNRRFDDFDVVSALDADGYSDYMGFTAVLERRVGEILTLVGSYTHSRTEDNWLSGSSAAYEAQLAPFPGGLDNSDWAEGTSDFDQPHRLAVGGELDFGAIGLAAFYRYESGLPFTPGFRHGVDANGDGSFSNDPAYVDDQIAGLAALFGSWDCLRSQAGSFADRNACRGPDVQTLDARLTVQPVTLGSFPVELVIDGLNLLDAEMAVLDRALYLVDPGGDLQVDPATGDVTVPLMVNEDFGKPIARRGMGRAVRIGLRVNYE